MQADIDAGSKTENKEIQYVKQKEIQDVKQGDTFRIKEVALKKRQKFKYLKSFDPSKSHK